MNWRRLKPGVYTAPGGVNIFRAWTGARRWVLLEYSVELSRHRTLREAKIEARRAFGGKQ